MLVGYYALALSKPQNCSGTGKHGVQSHELSSLLHLIWDQTKEFDRENNPEGTEQINTENCCKTVAGKLANCTLKEKYKRRKCGAIFLSDLETVTSRSSMMCVGTAFVVTVLQWNG